MATIRHHVLIDAPRRKCTRRFPRLKESALGGTNKRPPKQIAPHLEHIRWNRGCD